tara:strand:- start:972 stop:1163 length:192 start_codon:yes stop_codon:yes gene_type:complete
VPDHVFLGLIDGIIKGPLKILPKIYALVSLIKDNKKQRYKTFLSIIDKLNKRYKKIKIIIGKI